MADEQRTLAINLTANASGFANGTNEAIQKLKQLNTQVAENKQNIKQTSAEMKEYQRKLAELKAATDGGKKATEEEKQEMQRLKDAIARCAADIGSYQTAQQRLQSQIRSTNRELDEQRGSAQQVNEAFSTMGEVLKANLLSGAITTALEKLTGALQTCASYAYNVGSRFEAGMSQVEAISGASGATLDALTEKAKALGASTRFSASEAAQAMNYMAMAGWDAEQMLSGIDGVLSLAAASGADLGETADIVTDAITAFGLAAEDVGHFSDVLAAASANANTNVSMLGESFKYVAPLAGTMGYSIDEVAEALGIMANSGIKASTAGTSMRTILTNLTSGVTVSAEAFGEMEITAANADGSMKSLNEVLGELRAAFALMTDAEKTTNGNLIAGDRALSGFLSLVNAAPADIDKLRTAIENADGSAGNMAQTMTENVAGSVTIMNSALESLGIAVFEKFGDRINDVVVKVTDAVTDLTERIDGGELDDTFESLADSLGRLADDVLDFLRTGLPSFVEGLAKTITTISNLKTEISAGVAAFVAFKAAMGISKLVSGVVSSFKALSAAIGGAVSAGKSFNAVLAANPIGLAATALSLLTVGIVELSGHMDDCNERFEEFNSQSERAAESAQQLADEADGLQEIADKYEEITKQADESVEKKQQLEELQKTFIERYGSEVQGIDLVTGAYEKQAEVLQGVIDKKNEMSYNDALLAVQQAEKAESEDTLLNLTSQKGAWSVSNAAGRPWLWDSYRPSVFIEQNHNSYLSGSYENRIDILERAYESALAYEATEDAAIIKDTLDELKAAKAQKDAAVEFLNNFEKVDGKWAQKPDYSYKPLDYSKGYEALVQEAKDSFAAGKLSAEEYQRRLYALYNEFYGGEEGEKGSAANMSAEQREKVFDEESKSLQRALTRDEINEEEYYNRLAALRDEYLDAGTDKYEDVTDKIYVGTKKLREQVAKDGLGLGDAAADDAEKVKAALSDIQQSYKDTLAEIDKEFERRSQARTRAQEDEDYYSKREALTTRLAYDNLDAYSRRSLEKELAELDKEREDVLWERSGEDRKQSVTDAYETGQELLQGSPLGGMSTEDWAQAVLLVTDEVIRAGAAGKLDSSINAVNKYINVVINSQGKSEEQIQKLVFDTIASDSV